MTAIVFSQRPGAGDMQYFFDLTGNIFADDITELGRNLDEITSSGTSRKRIVLDLTRADTSLFKPWRFVGLCRNIANRITGKGLDVNVDVHITMDHQPLLIELDELSRFTVVVAGSSKQQAEDKAAIAPLVPDLTIPQALRPAEVVRGIVTDILIGTLTLVIVILVSRALIVGLETFVSSNSQTIYVVTVFGQYAVFGAASVFVLQFIIVVALTVYFSVKPESFKRLAIANAGMGPAMTAAERARWYPARAVVVSGVASYIAGIVAFAMVYALGDRAANTTEPLGQVLIYTASFVLTWEIVMLAAARVSQQLGLPRHAGLHAFRVLP